MTLFVDNTEDASNRKTRRSDDLRAVVTPSRLVEVCDMDFADVAFLGHGPRGMMSFGVEIKSLSDLLSSIVSGRLAGHQIPGLLECYDRSWVLIEGEWEVDEEGVLVVPKGRHRFPIEHGRGRPWMYREIVNWMATVSVQTGVHFWRTQSREETARWISAMYWWAQKDWSDHKSLKVFVDDPQPVLLVRPDFKARVVRQVEGLGWDKALKISRAFSTGREIACASKEEFLKIEGIGPMLAQRLEDAWMSASRPTERSKRPSKRMTTDSSVASGSGSIRGGTASTGTSRSRQRTRGRGQSLRPSPKSGSKTSSATPSTTSPRRR
jgi:ERCC4-type nuclease